MPKIAPTSRAMIVIDGINAFDPDSPDAVVDPTTLPIFVAFPAPGQEPTDDQWVRADWSGPKKARVLVGPGAVVLALGHYDVWANVVGTVESPKWKVGELAVGVG